MASDYPSYHQPSTHTSVPSILQPGYPSQTLPQRPRQQSSASTSTRTSQLPYPEHDILPALPPRFAASQVKSSPQLPRRPVPSPSPYYSNFDVPPPYDDGARPESSIPEKTPIYPRRTSSAQHSSAFSTPSTTNSSEFTATRTNTSESDLLDAEDVKLLEAGINAIPAALPSPSYYPRLEVPIVIPQLSVRSRLLHVMPFTRAYAPIAGQYGLSPKHFVRMIDTINICIAAYPPFQVMHLAAAGIGIVPEPLFIGISWGLDALASAGTRVTKYYRLKAFMDKMNKDVWAPRGLEMKIVKDPELVRDMLGMNETTLLMDMGQLKQQEQQGQLPEPLSQRRYRLLKSRVADLDFDVPPAENVGNIIDKVSAKNQARKTESKKKKLFKRQQKFDERVQLQQFRRGSEDQVKPSVASWENGRTKIKSNAMEYDDSSVASSDTDDSGIGDEATALERATARADAKAAEVNAKTDGKLAAGSRNAERIEEKRKKELGRIEEKWVKEKLRVEEMREKRLEKRIKGNQKRLEKVAKRMQRMEWIVIDNLSYAGDTQGNT